MLQQKLFQQLSEQIHQYAYGDSIHFRYVVLYTSYENLIIIAEDKYKLSVQIETLKWKRDPIISMKFQTFAVHILTMEGEYIEILLSNLFQQNKQQDNLLSIIEINEAYLPNNMKLKEAYQIKRFSDFVIMNKIKLKIAFISQQGQILFYSPDQKVITQIIALRQSLVSFQTIEIDQKEMIVGVTELNDLITFSDNEQEPQIHRFTDPNYSINHIYFVGNENILILQEKKAEYRFVKYQLKQLKFVKKYYYLPKDDCHYKFIEIHELPKIFIALVFSTFSDQFQIISFSKKVLQDRIFKNIQLNFQNVIDEFNNPINFSNILNCPETSTLNIKEIQNQAIHFSKYNQQFGIKITKKKMNEVLQSDSQILNKDDQVSKTKNYDQFCSLLITSTQIYTISISQDCVQELTFKVLQQFENYQRTFGSIPQIKLSWQEQVISNLWHHLNCEQGLKLYFSKKDQVSESIHSWVNSLKFTQQLIYQIPEDDENQEIEIETQYDKCLTTIALLNFKNLSNEISISKIVAMVFNKALAQCSKIVTDNSNSFLQLIQCIKQNSNPVLCYNYWKHSQQLLFILINILEVWLTNTMIKYDVILLNSQEFFEPLFFNKIRSLIVCAKVPIMLRLKLIIFLQDSSFIKLFTLGVQTISERQELIQFSKVCNITNDAPSFNIFSISYLIDECDKKYIQNLIQISGNLGSMNKYEPTKVKNPSFGLIIMSILKQSSNEYEICKIINWFLS
ncbi:unnamed protein product [Paramecium sonneborni]|uniref:Uncharacterized protein n=1 Tax=Paramecium sonneborni TaxID=65129 RepID=A0A8S1LEB7_9CILI|nr:unnamed protein product [Paramecium sonneborni]